MKLRAIFTASLVVFGESAARAQNAVSLELPISGIERIELQIPEASLQLVGSPGSRGLRLISAADLSELLKIEKKNSTLILSMKTEKSGLFTAGSSKKISFEINGSPLKTEVFLGEGALAVQKWSQELSVTAQKAKVLIQNSSASSSLVSLHRGDLQVIDSTGTLAVDSYSANVSVKQHMGDLRIENFSGETFLEKVKGNMNIQQAGNQMKVVGSSGTISFDLLKGQASVQSFIGRVDGQSMEGAVSLIYAPETEMNVKTKSGRVTVQIPAGQGPYLSLTANDGEILVPASIKVSREAAQKTVRSRFSGGNAKGTITVRAEEGSIQVR
ncbi:MAG: DUF4097 family beta strand repeat-containing protein [Proteobacteria bacterium]|nr:DUF4097 family beta strand repeat-containing protein [Pseudomonadota bacterium]